MSSSLPLDYIRVIPENCVVKDMSDTAILDMLFEMTRQYEAKHHYLSCSHDKSDKKRAKEHSEALAEVTRIVLQDRKFGYGSVKYLQELLEEEA